MPNTSYFIARYDSKDKLFTNKSREILNRRDILPDSHSGFRLQTRVLLFLEQVSSCMTNSSRVITIFVDFKSAFDHLWFDGCLGKLRMMRIRKSYIKWIKPWLENRRAYIEI
jgi:hypothetical protein